MENFCNGKAGYILNKSLHVRKMETGFKRASTFLNHLTQKSFERKGFAQAKLITNWNEIVGLDFCKFTKPLKISFPKNELGATLTIEIDGAFGPELEMQKEMIKEKVNRIYGYKSVAKIKFKVSSHLGYEALKKDRSLFDQIGKSCEAEISYSGDQAETSLTSRLDDVKNKKLRKSLLNLSNSFGMRMKLQKCSK